jgi:F0F1-type ATP synthase delta subunit
MKIDPSALKELKIFLDKKDGTGSGRLTVVSAYKLDPEEKSLLLTFLKKNGLSDIKLNEEVEKDVLGGIILVAGSTVVDLSLRGQLTNLKKELYAIT